MMACVLRNKLSFQFLARQGDIAMVLCAVNLNIASNPCDAADVTLMQMAGNAGNDRPGHVLMAWLLKRNAARLESFKRLFANGIGRLPGDVICPMLSGCGVTTLECVLAFLRPRRHTFYLFR